MLSIGYFISSSLCAQSLAPVGGGEHIFSKAEECITEDQRQESQLISAANSKRLHAAGVMPPPDRSSTTSFEWPMQAHPDLVYNSYYAISNYVDQDPTDSIGDYNCQSRSYDDHRGTDYFTWPFDWYLKDNDLVEVIAAADGTIIFHQEDQDDDHCNCFGLWNAIYLEHSDGSISWYGHLKKNSLTSKQVGDQVVTGEYLGVLASSGCSTGPHLHFEVYESLPYTFANLIDPYEGNCNSLNTDSWWADQQNYVEPTLNAALTHDAAPMMGCPSILEEPHFADTFYTDQIVYTAAYYRDQQQGGLTTHTLRRPDNSIYTSWIHDSPQSYVSSYWYWTWNLGSAPYGEWIYEVSYAGTSDTHTFAYLDIDCQDPGVNVYVGPLTGMWNDDNNWSRGFSPKTCDDVIIPTGHTVIVLAGETASCDLLDVLTGATLDVHLGGELDVNSEG